MNVLAKRIADQALHYSASVQITSVISKRPVTATC
jgi:hypothetical protein